MFPSLVSQPRTIIVLVRLLEERVDLLVVDEREPEVIQRCLDFLLVEGPVPVLVPARKAIGA